MTRSPDDALDALDALTRLQAADAPHVTDLAYALVTELVTARDIAELIRRDAGLSTLVEILGPRLADGDASHAFDHLLRVAVWTVRLTQGQPTVRLGVATALLHDAVNVPKRSPECRSAGTRSAELAARLLPGLGFTSDEVLLACDAIRSHSRSRGLRPWTRFGRAFQDADRLDALGAMALTRALTTGGQIKQEIMCWHDPWAERRPLAPKRFTVDHVLAELLPLPTKLHTAAARDEGARRADTMTRMLEILGAELGAPFPTSHFHQLSSGATLLIASPTGPMASTVRDDSVRRAEFVPTSAERIVEPMLLA